MASSRQKRKRRRREGVPAGQPSRSDASQTPSRSEQKNAAARAALTPLAPGERPLAVTIGAILAAFLGLSNLVLYAAGVDIRGEDPNLGAPLFAVLMLAAAWGMWKVRYWAVLGMQALLGLLIVIFSLVAMTAEDVWGVLLAAAIVVPAGTLFWFMVKAMARIQMPVRDQ